jgi:short subunit dehydrogenase-like uncharacterized protein
MHMQKNWMIYGAYGFTGQLIIDEALQRGHRPLLAGRSGAQLYPLAERFGLQAQVVDLEDGEHLRTTLEAVDLVLHTAGPFSHTGMPMQAACLDTHTHYLDITGELPVFQQTLAQNAQAHQSAICLVSGVGFEVLPTDCLAMQLAQQIEEADHLELAIASMGGGISAGTLKSTIEILAGGNFARRNGILIDIPKGEGLKQVRFPDRVRPVVRGPIGDLVTAYASTGIPNITTYLGQTRLTAFLAHNFAPLLQALLKRGKLRRWAQAMAGRVAHGPSREAQFTHRSYAWGRVTAPDGRMAEAALEMPEPYRFTALSAVRAAEHILEHAPAGALTPGQAFGIDFMDTIPGVN